MKKLFLVAAALLLAGCAASGTQINESQIAEFVPGKTTVADVVGKLGVPNQTVTGPDGTKTLVYSYVQVQTRPETLIPVVGAFIGGADVKTSVAVLRFSRRGVFIDSATSIGASGSGMGLASGTGFPERVPDQPRQAP